MGKIANKHVGSDPFSKKVHIWTKKFPPLSCIIDGIQLSSGCTIGKGSIIIKPGELPMSEFINNNGKKIQIELRPHIKNEIKQNVNKENMEIYAKKIYQMFDKDLFKIKK